MERSLGTFSLSRALAWIVRKYAPCTSASTAGPKWCLNGALNSARRAKPALPGSSANASQKKHAAVAERLATATHASVVGSQPASWNSFGSSSMPGPTTLFATSTTAPKVPIVFPPKNEGSSEPIVAFETVRKSGGRPPAAGTGASESSAASASASAPTGASANPPASATEMSGVDVEGSSIASAKETYSMQKGPQA